MKYWLQLHHGCCSVSCEPPNGQRCLSVRLLAGLVSGMSGDDPYFPLDI